TATRRRRRACAFNARALSRSSGVRLGSHRPRRGAPSRSRRQSTDARTTAGSSRRFRFHRSDGRRARGTTAVNWRDDRGQIAGIEAVPSGILLFGVGALLIANAGTGIDVKMAVTSAAREAARTYVEAPDHDTGIANAEAAARAALVSHGRNGDRMSIVGPA